MKREEQIEKKAEELAKKYLPDDDMWERPNIVEAACLEMAEWSDENPKEGLISIDKAIDWLEGMFGFLNENGNNFNSERFIKNFKNAMEK